MVPYNSPSIYKDFALTINSIAWAIKGFDLYLPGLPLYSYAEIPHGMWPTGHSQCSQGCIHSRGVSAPNPFWSLHSHGRDIISRHCNHGRGEQAVDLSKWSLSWRLAHTKQREERKLFRLKTCLCKMTTRASKLKDCRSSEVWPA